tara:strand:+ start:1205 stop:2107 length:903 start_codon:yes stop_codon:yes gene_type:complete
MDRKEPCQCDTFGFCDRYLKEVTELERNLCQEREDYRESFYRLSLDRINLKKERAKEVKRVAANNKASSVAAIHLCGGLFNFLRSKFFLKEERGNKEVSIKGLERSGTGFVYDLLEKNLLSTELEQAEKHHYYSTPTSVSAKVPHLDVDSPVILCVKNPYSWWLSFSDFGKTGREVENSRDYSDPKECIELWNSFYNSWINSKRDTLILRYEDILVDEKKEIERVSKFLGVRHTRIGFKVEQYINNYVSRQTETLGGKFDRKDYFLSKRYLDSMKDEDIISIYNDLDRKLLRKLGYKKEP